MKPHSIALATLLAAALFGAATPAHGQQRKRVAVVLSGGGAKGMAHIGALKVIERAGIPIDIVTGTSMGSIIGGLYAVGWNAQALDTLVRKQDWTFLLSDKDDYYSQPLVDRERQNTYFLSKAVSLGKRNVAERGGLIHGKNLARLFDHLTAGYTDSISFSRLPIPFACVATNIVDNTEYDFHSGRLSEAMRASMAIPGAFTPIRKGEMVLVDGGLRNNYPADIARAMGADYIIGVTVQGAPKTADDLTSGTEILSQIVDVNCKNKYDENLAITNVPIRVNTKGYGSASFSKVAIDTLIRRGEEEAMRHWDELVALKRELGMADGDTISRLQPAEEALAPLDFASPTGKKGNERPAHDRLQGSVGVRFDSEEMAAVKLDGLYQSAKRPIDAEIMLRLGKRVWAQAKGSVALHGVAKATLGYTFRYNDIDGYDHGSKHINTTFSHHQVALSLMGVGVKNLLLDLTARWDYYHYNKLLVVASESTQGLNVVDPHFFSYHANLRFDSENTGLFPTRGAKFQAHYAYYTDNFADYKGHAGFSELNGLWRISLAATRRFTLQPMVYGRMIFGSDIPMVRRNMIGGQWFGQYSEQQLPLAGLGHVEFADPMLLACQLKAQEQLTTNNFILLKVVAMQHSERLKALFDHGPTMGYQLAYYYRTLFGPVGATLGYSDQSKKVNFYVNLGFQF